MFQFVTGLNLEASNGLDSLRFHFCHWVDTNRNEMNTTRTKIKSSSNTVYFLLYTLKM